MTFRLIQGDNRQILKTIADNSIDAIVTDPPYGIDFLGKSWDADTGALETYQECLRVLKPGGHILAFSAARTYHHLAITLEQAGFEIRDQIMWIYSSGFPKSQNVGKSIQRSLGVKEKVAYKHNSPRVGGDGEFGADGTKQETVCTDDAAKQWEGWGTALKPAHEPICMARKPLKQSIAKNVQQWGTGAVNINATRIAFDDTDNLEGMKRSTGSDLHTFTNYNPEYRVNKDGAKNNDHDLEEVVYEPSELGRFPSNVLGEIPDYQKYFYCPKASRKERHIGFDLNEIPTDPSGDQDSSNGGNYIKKKQGLITNDEMLAKMSGHWLDDQGNQVGSEREGSKMLWLPHTGAIFTHGLKHEYEKWCKANGIDLGNVGNNHPTVKPVALMEYLIKLITPPGGHVLDPFNGSGSTGMAAVGLGFEYTGIDLNEDYIAISHKRIAAWSEKDNVDNIINDLFEYAT